MLRQHEQRANITQSTGLETVPSHVQKKPKTRHTPTLPQPSALTPSVLASDVLDFYPDTQLALRLWNVYVKSVDPVLKILHIPTVQSTVISTILDPRSAPSSTLALTYAIYFAAVTALCHENSDDTAVDPHRENMKLLKRFKLALDRLLLVTDVMNQPDVTALQALAIYVTCLRVHEVGRSVWVLNGLAIRLAQSIGLHRDGTSLQLSPFETEMRLRLWWHLCVLDSRAPEDQGFQPTVDITNRDLRLPLNVNDNQLYPDMASFPEESNGWTEMSFFLIQTEGCRLLYPILDVHVQEQQHSADAAYLDVTAKRELIQERGRYLSAKYGILSRSGVLAPVLSRIADQHTTTACRKMEFVLQLREEIISMRKQKGAPMGVPRDGDDGDATTPTPTSDVLKPSFQLACAALESHYVLQKDSLTSGFRWFFNMYTQWYALAYVLRCLCSGGSGGSSPVVDLETERAWTLVEELFPRGMTLDGHSTAVSCDHGPANSIWQCLNLLRAQVMSLRQCPQQQQQQQQSMATGNVEIQPSFTTTTTASSSGNHYPHHHSHHHGPSQLLRSDTSIVHGISSTLSELGQEGFIVDPHPSNTIIPPSSLDLSMPDNSMPFLPDPDWSAVINGWLNDDAHSSVL
ncbi:hypothetical protein AYL99_03544 [Fonsecaea erecta]|uniref:Xylanolytic transcriptional activator regulatory domain-containing protein n=1 Tax=Fonsecaea erecta TaxID=1367422 RepID=A0A178ZPE9_9EURO|nr:hypothetical protein AYL99_03544 [Fonsecaea erecta]OAP61341.1 hypothetical protein AYL99_03544 [Fonsecaea erecta]